MKRAINNKKSKNLRNAPEWQKGNKTFEVFFHRHTISLVFNNYGANQQDWPLWLRAAKKGVT